MIFKDGMLGSVYYNWSDPYLNNTTVLLDNNNDNRCKCSIIAGAYELPKAAKEHEIYIGGS